VYGAPGRGSLIPESKVERSTPDSALNVSRLICVFEENFPALAQPDIPATTYVPLPGLPTARGIPGEAR
jgi:hypothetical protein